MNLDLKFSRNLVRDLQPTAYSSACVRHSGHATMVIGGSNIVASEYDLQTYFFDERGEPHVHNFTGKLLRPKCEFLGLCAWMEQPDASLRVAVTFKDPSDQRRNGGYKIKLCGWSASVGFREWKSLPLSAPPLGIYLIDHFDSQQTKYLVVCCNDSNIHVFIKRFLGTFEKIGTSMQQHPLREFQDLGSPIFSLDTLQDKGDVYIATGATSGLMRISYRNSQSISTADYTFASCVTCVHFFSTIQKSYLLCLSSAIYVLEVNPDLKQTNLILFPEGSACDLLICATTFVVEDSVLIMVGSYDGWVSIYQLKEDKVELIKEEDFTEPIYRLEVLCHALGAIDLCVISLSKIQTFSLIFDNLESLKVEIKPEIGTEIT